MKRETEKCTWSLHPKQKEVKGKEEQDEEGGGKERRAGPGE